MIGRCPCYKLRVFLTLFAGVLLGPKMPCHSDPCNRNVLFSIGSFAEGNVLTLLILLARCSPHSYMCSYSDGHFTFCVCRNVNIFIA